MCGGIIIMTGNVENVCESCIDYPFHEYVAIFKIVLGHFLYLKTCVTFQWKLGIKNLISIKYNWESNVQTVTTYL